MHNTLMQKIKWIVNKLKKRELDVWYMSVLVYKNYDTIITLQ